MMSYGLRWIMTEIEVIDRQRQIIKDQADLIAELVYIIKQSELTGPGVDELLARSDALEVNV